MLGIFNIEGPLPYSRTHDAQNQSCIHFRDIEDIASYPEGLMPLYILDT